MNHHVEWARMNRLLSPWFTWSDLHDCIKRRLSKEDIKSIAFGGNSSKKNSTRSISPVLNWDFETLVLISIYDTQLRGLFSKILIKDAYTSPWLNLKTDKFPGVNLSGVLSVVALYNIPCKVNQVALAFTRSITAYRLSKDAVLCYPEFVECFVRCCAVVTGFQTNHLHNLFGLMETQGVLLPKYDRIFLKSKPTLRRKCDVQWSGDSQRDSLQNQKCCPKTELFKEIQNSNHATEENFPNLQSTLNISLNDKMFEMASILKGTLQSSQLSASTLLQDVDLFIESMIIDNSLTLVDVFIQTVQKNPESELSSNLLSKFFARLNIQRRVLAPFLCDLLSREDISCDDKSRIAMILGCIGNCESSALNNCLITSSSSKNMFAWGICRSHKGMQFLCDILENQKYSAAVRVAVCDAFSAPTIVGRVHVVPIQYIPTAKSCSFKAEFISMDGSLQQKISLDELKPFEVRLGIGTRCLIRLIRTVLKRPPSLTQEYAFNKLAYLESSIYSDTEPSVQIAAIKSIGTLFARSCNYSMKKHVASLTTRLNASLSSFELPQLQQAINTLGKIPVHYWQLLDENEIVENLVKYTIHEHWKVRFSAVEALGIYGLKYNVAAPQCAIAIKHAIEKKNIIHPIAGRALAKIPLFGADILFELINSPKVCAQVKASAIRGLSCLTDQQESVVELLYSVGRSSPSALVRFAAIETLGELINHDREMHSFLCNAMRDPCSLVSRKAAVVLATIHPQGELLLVEVMQKVSATTTKVAALHGLFSIGLRSLKTILNARVCKNMVVRNTAKELILKFNPQELQEFLSQRDELQEFITLMNKI